MTRYLETVDEQPTRQMYQELQEAFDFFNRELFDGMLPNCMITLQRQKKTMGYFSAGRFTNRKKNGLKKADEIAMNPSYFSLQTIQEAMQTLVHECCHVWQHHYGNPGRGRYHNEEWANKMIAIGLIPSNTGKPGGKMTGDQMMDYPEPGGLFEQACTKLLTANFTLSWLDRFPVSVRVLADTLHQLPEETRIALSDEQLADLSIELVENVEAKKPTQQRYVCPLCDIKVWGKPNLEIICKLCNQQLQ